MATSNRLVIRTEADKALTEKKGRKKIDSIEVVHHGDALVIPEGITLEQAERIIALKRVEEETIVQFSAAIPASPFDGAYALSRALEKMFGIKIARPTPGFFGDYPPEMMTVEIDAHGGTVQVPWGQFQVPYIEGRIESSFTFDQGRIIFMVGAVIKQKHKDKFDQLVQLVKQFLAESSIYKGKAIRVAFTQDNGKPMRMPEIKYIDVDNVTKPIFTKLLEDQMEYDVLAYIRQAEAIKKMQGGVLKRGVLLAGPYGCLAGDTMISYNRGGNGRQICLEDLVTKVNGDDQRPRYKWDKSIPTYVQREMPDGTIRLGLLSKAWCSGMKRTCQLTTDTGRSIRATDEHPFLTERGWLRLDQLQIGDLLHVRGPQSTGNGTARERGERPPYKALSVGQFHPYGKGSPSQGYHVAEHRLVLEANMNGLSLESYIEALKHGETHGFEYLNPETDIVHHKDGNTLNNNLSNLEVIEGHGNHARLHSEESTPNVLFKATTESVVSIEEWGEEMTYDIEVEGEPHNFVANGFVVHNTGKSLSANYIAKVAEENGFTFIYAKAQDVPYAIDFARSYLPAVVFAEDIDMVATAERTEDVGKLLNKLDGIDTKRQDIIFVATTNHPDSINAALLRPGRIDLVMLVEPPDAEAAIRVARWYASGEGESSLGGMEDGDEHFREAGILLAGMIPATIQEVVRRAQVRAFARTNGESSTISNQDLVNAAQYVKREQQLTNPVDIKSDPVKKLGDAFGQGLGVGIGKVLRMALPPQQAQIIQGTLPLELQEPAGVGGASNHQEDADEEDEG